MTAQGSDTALGQDFRDRGGQGFLDKGAPGEIRAWAVLAVSAPFIVSSVMYSLKLTLDRLLLSWHSHVSMSAGLTAGMTSYMAAGIFIGIAGYASILVSQLDGEGLREKIGPCVWQSVIFSLSAGAALLLLGFAAAPVFLLAGHAPAMAAEEAASFRILSGGSVLSLAATSLMCFWTGRNRTWTAVAVNLASFLPSAAVTWALVFGAEGYVPAPGASAAGVWAASAFNSLAAAAGTPSLGAAGAAWGTVTGDAIKCAVLLILFLAPENARRYGTRPGRLFEPKAAAGLMRGGLGNGVHLFLSVGSLAAFNLAVGVSGAASGALEAAGASAVAFSFSSAALLPLVGLGSAIALLVGHGMGAGDPSYARNALACSGRIAFLYLSAVAATCLVFPEAIVSLFSGEEASGGVRREAAALVSLSGAFIVCDGFSLLFCGAARGAGDTLYIMKMTGGVSALQMALAALACLYGAGAGGLWLVLVLASFAKAALVFLRLSGGAWLTNVTAGSLFSEGSLSS